MNGGERRGRRDMVQPGGGGGAGPGPAEAGGAAGEEAAAAAAAGRGPAELGGSPEVLQRLLEENRELKGALSRCSACLRLRLDELRRLQGQRRGEWQLLWGRWGQARALVERLRRERDEAARWHRGDVGDTADTADTAATAPSHPGDAQSPEVTPQEEVTPEVTAEVTAQESPLSPPRRDEDVPVSPPDPSPTEQLRQRLAAAEAELATAREAQAAAERRAQDVTRRAELQLQALRRQLEQDKAQVQAQVTSLLGELRESQSRLERSRRDRDELEQRARVAGERCHTLEEVTKGHGLQLDQLRLQVQNLETALRVERHAATEEKRKLVQLQVAYHHLFQEYDAHIKAGALGDTRDQELGDARARLAAAEEALAAKQELIDKLKSEAERQRATMETIPVLQAQAEIYRADFEAERAAREQLHAQRDALQEALRSLRLRLDSEGAQRLRMEELRNRHSTPGPVFGGSRPPQTEEEQPDLCCPKCQYRAPDMDTLQIHVTECIE
ncbi:NF-kappa-B essential modulator [Caloenas nicobarica]|uniref:NF-kappa-B essential modulator n=1 Tax=Caloenas nicobarica TaxID=187106 RepID=UPI0032B83B05